MPGVQEALDAVFGCCLGRRCRWSDSEQGRGIQGSGADERTPLLADREGTNKAVGGRHDSTEYIGTHDARATSASKKAAEGDPALGLGRRRRQIDASRLQTIQNRANSAFFNVDSSQLLPSSSSMAQRQVAMSASQRLNRREHRHAEDEDDQSTQRRRELIIASDQAERLYVAAMKTEACRRSSSKDAEKDFGTGAHGEARTSPVGLVRQVRLSIYDTSHPGVAAAAAPAPVQTRPEPRTSGSARSTKRSPSNLTPDALATASTSFDSVAQSPAARHVPSIHSLRTLRLGVVTDDADNESLTGSRAAFLSESVASGTTDGAHDRLRARSQEEEEAWEQRGRTRSRRGLVWTDATAREVDQAKQVGNRVGLDQIFPQSSEAKGDEAEQSGADEIQNGIRFNHDDGERRRKIMESLQHSAVQTVSDMWEEAGNVSTNAIETQ